MFAPLAAGPLLFFAGDAEGDSAARFEPITEKKGFQSVPVDLSSIALGCETDECGALQVIMKTPEIYVCKKCAVTVPVRCHLR